jgi:predicted metal-dependent peptidase
MHDSFEAAKARLMLEHPFLGSVASTLRLEADENTLTFQSDGEVLRYNPEYLHTRAKDYEVLFALANGAMHSLLGHKRRAGKRVPRLWRAAGDLVVNAILVKNGFTLPADAYYDEHYASMYVEEVYDRLVQEMRHNDTLDEAEEGETNDETSSQNNGSEERNPPPRNETTKMQEMSYDEAELEALYEQLFEKHRKRGEIPRDLHYLLPEFFSRRIDWREALYRYIAEYAKSTYRFMPPNVKHLYRGVALPAAASDLLRIVIVVDTSGSIDDDLLRLFLGEVESIMQTYGNYEIDLIAADASVRSHRTYLPGERLEYKAEGRGGTDFRAAIEYVTRHIDYPSAMLYFTDGQGLFPDTPPPFDVLWVMPAMRDVPFGEVLLIESDETEL